MAAAQGFTEVSNYSFMSEEVARLFDLDPSMLVEVANPIASEQTLLRSSLLPGIWQNITGNKRYFDSFRLFEIGHEIHRDRESPHLAAAIYAKDDGVAGLLELKRLAECLVPGITVRPATTRSYEHPQRAAEVYRDETRIGRLFEFHPKMVDAGRAAVVDLDLMLVEELQRGTVRYQPLRRFPTSAFDLSVVAGSRELIGEIQKRLAGLAGDSLVSITFLRDFAMPDGTRSISYRLSIGALDRTLSSDEVGSIRTRIIEGMQAAGYELKV
jgi:phenylalanyl-tRNA synthetase beta chain